MKNSAHIICLCVAAAGFLCLLRDLPVRRKDPASTALASVFLLSAGSFFLALVSTGKYLDRLLGTANLSVPLSQACVLGLLACQQVVLTHWGSPPEVARRMSRRWLITGGAAITTLWLVFLLFSPTVQRLRDFTLYYSPDNGHAVYLTVYCTAYTLGELALAHACWRLARRSTRASVRVGLRFVTVGALVTLGSSAVRLGNVAASKFGSSFESWETLAWICGDGGALLTLVGWLIPTGADHAERLRRWTRQHRAYRGLRPLWLAYYADAPELAFPVDRSDRRYFTRIALRLYRRTIEIHDGNRRILPFLDAEVREAGEARHRAAGLTGDDLLAAVTADQIRAGIIARAQGIHPARTVDLADTERRLSRPTDDDDALLAVAWHLHRTAARADAEAVRMATG
ncbi:MAB_1171c family putative transporter [Streptomyces sp. NPDC087440]|uniref:MAB_1171c family putative transporter n=1 Tax=Streptomyces sp. NPDC087440 TaxID=3365790 RepID=UPI0038162F81